MDATLIEPFSAILSPIKETPDTPKISRKGLATMALKITEPQQSNINTIRMIALIMLVRFVIGIDNAFFPML
jgi:hypothetical protein